MLRIVPQRGRRDCGVAALAMLSKRSYNAVRRVVLALEPEWTSDDPMKNAGVVAVAARLDVPLRPSRAFDLDADVGILRLRGNGWQHRYGHLVALHDGLIYCPQFPHPSPWRDYLSTHDGRPCTLLKGTT